LRPPGNAALAAAGHFGKCQSAGPVRDLDRPLGIGLAGPARLTGRGIPAPDRFRRALTVTAEIAEIADIESTFVRRTIITVSQNQAGQMSLTDLISNKRGELQDHIQDNLLSEKIWLKRAEVEPLGHRRVRGRAGPGVGHDRGPERRA
jgi:hypothetical protein